MPYEIRVNSELSEEQLLESLREHMNNLAYNFYSLRLGLERPFSPHSILFEIKHLFSPIVKDVKESENKITITLRVRGRNDHQPINTRVFERLEAYLVRNNIEPIYEYDYTSGEEL